MEIMVPMVGVLAMVLLGVLAHFFGEDSRMSVRNERNVWNDRKDW